MKNPIEQHLMAKFMFGCLYSCMFVCACVCMLCLFVHGSNQQTLKTKAMCVRVTIYIHYEFGKRAKIVNSGQKLFSCLSTWKVRFFFHSSHPMICSNICFHLWESLFKFYQTLVCFSFHTFYASSMCCLFFYRVRLKLLVRCWGFFAFVFVFVSFVWGNDS